ncbi:MAG: cell division protein ZapA [Terriglobales bacterium]
MSSKASTRVNIYGQNYSFAGSDAEAVQRLADSVDAKMRQVARETHVVDSLRVAVLAAINLADENERLRAQVDGLQHKLGGRIRAMNANLERLLHRAS